MSKHTPGPWEADHSYPMFVGTAHAVKGRDFHCVVGRDCDAHVIGNTNLMAAAPRLLEALKEISERLNCGDGVHYCPNCDRSMFPLLEVARAAIREAEGEA